MDLTVRRAVRNMIAAAIQPLKTRIEALEEKVTDLEKKAGKG